MNMQDNDTDWLERRLAARDYLPDDGFTARVARRLPQSPRRVLAFRTTILSFAGVMACLLFALQLWLSIPEAAQFWAQSGHGELLGKMAFYVHQPVFFLGAAVAISVGALASIPFLRRWE